ncbi:MAG: MFS transporter [Candidatus Bathyarchaeia archaeon]
MGIHSKLREEFSFVKGNFLILVISWILIDFAGELPGTYFSLYVLALGGTELAIGLIGFASFIALASVQFPGGFLADKYGRRWLISTMTFALALSFILYAVAPTWHFILVGAVLTNLCLIYQPALMAMVADSLPPERRGMGFSIINLIAAVSTTPAPIIAGLLFVQYDLVPSMRINYFIVTTFYLTAALLRLKLKETIKDPKKITRKELLGSYPKAIKESIDVWKIVPKAMLFLFLANLVGTFSGAMITPYVVVYAVRVLHVGEFEWSLILTFLFVVMIVSALPCGKLIDKVGRKKPLLFGYLLLIPAIWLVIYGDLFKLFLALPFLGLSQILMMSSISSLQADLVPQEQRGKVIGFTNFVNYIVTALGQLAGGILYQNISPQVPFIISLSLVLPEFLMILMLVHEPEKREA